MPSNGQKIPKDVLPPSKPFKPSPKIPVPPEVAESFRKLRNAGIALGKSHSVAKPASREAAMRAFERLQRASQEAARHFEGGEKQMGRHYGRWLRSKGAFMGVGETGLPVESAKKALRSAERHTTSEGVRKSGVKRGRPRA